jgi:hypothetical protein
MAIAEQKPNALPSQEEVVTIPKSPHRKAIDALHRTDLGAAGIIGAAATALPSAVLAVLPQVINSENAKWCIPAAALFTAGSAVVGLAAEIKKEREIYIAQGNKLEYKQEKGADRFWSDLGHMAGLSSIAAVGAASSVTIAASAMGVPIEQIIPATIAEFGNSNRINLLPPTFIAGSVLGVSGYLSGWNIIDRIKGRNTK